MPSKLIRRQPPTLLTNIIHHFWFAERDFNSPDSAIDLLPDSFVELVFVVSGALTVERGGSVQALSSAFIVGLLSKPLRLHGRGIVQTAAARFFPWGLSALFDLAPGELRSLDMTSPVEQLHADAANQNPDALLNILESFCVEQLLSRTSKRAQRVRAAERLLRDKGQFKVRELAHQAFYSTRQFERHVRDATGVPPKTLARQTRFQVVRDAITAEPGRDLKTLAHACGYADQAHMTREFKRFSEKTPKQFATEMQRLRDSLQADYHVVFLQDLIR